MVQLRTVDDFERAAKAFGDSNAESYQYQVRSFGYCIKCEQVAEYESSGSIEGVYEKCLSCDASKDGFGSPSIILSGKMIPAGVKSEVDRLHSRKQQREYFNTLVAQRFSAIKSEILGKQKEIQELNEDSKRLAKLISS